MTPFKAPLEDILFCLTHVAGAARLPDWDDELAEGILDHFGAFAEGVIAPLDEPGDAQGCALNDGRVTMPDGFKPAFDQLVEGFGAKLLKRRPPFVLGQIIGAFCTQSLAPLALAEIPTYDLRSPRLR